MDYKKIGAGFAVFVVVALAGSAIVSAANPQSELRGFGNKMNNDHRLGIDTAIESGDYQTFKSLVGDKGRMSEVVTADNFDQFVKMHNLIKDGNFAEAKVIGEELGLGAGRGMFGERGAGRGGQNGQGPNFVDSNGDGLCDHADIK